MNTNVTEQTLTFKTFTPTDAATVPTAEVADFLFTHLDEYGDTKKAITACLNYALSAEPGKGGTVTLGYLGDELVGAVITNRTGMHDYIPENILVYIAIANTVRGKGLGKKLMQQVIDHTQGSIALHVEPQNPARHLYEKLGFTNKYLEYRLQR